MFTIFCSGCSEDLDLTIGDSFERTAGRLYDGPSGAFAQAWVGSRAFSTVVAPGGELFLSASGSGYTYAEAAGVIPEPAAWSLMIAGFGLVGVTLRRRMPIPPAAETAA